MRHSAICSSRAVLLIAVIAGVWASAPPVFAKVLMTQEEALAAAFPGQTGVKRSTVYLTDEQAAAVQRLSTEETKSRVVTYYTGREGTAWFDSHIVRTLPETVMIVVSPAGSIVRIDILSFGEPMEYLPRPKWFEQLHGRALDEDLSLRRGVRPITGATLSARAVVSAARRVLALHRVVVGQPPPGSGDGRP